MDRHDPPDADELDRRISADEHIDNARRSLYIALQSDVPPHTTFSRAHYIAGQVIKAIRVLDTGPRR